MSLPTQLYTAAQVRALDRHAIETLGITGSTLMARAGRAAFEVLREHWPQARRIAVVCGSGNNGGDGYVVAQLAHEAGLDVQVFATVSPDALKHEAAVAAQAARAAGVMIGGLTEDLRAYDLIVDAVLGIGVVDEVRGGARDAIGAINASGVPVLALDIPSGLDSDRGAVQGVAVVASATITFIGLKVGLVTGDGPDCVGHLEYADLGLPPDVFMPFNPRASRIDAALLGELVPRHRGAHKGDFGHVLVVGGDYGMGGAARLAGEAALRVGAGLVSLATRPEHTNAITAARPELMCHGIESPGALVPLLERADVVVIGPGLGRGQWGAALLARVLECHKPLVVDADALNLLADQPIYRERWVLTPHPGEAARLLGAPVAEIQGDRLAAAERLRDRYGGVVVLKGAGTVIDGGGLPAVCSAGNPGMASGGMGDLLTGVIAGLIAQGWSTAEAARLGVCLHAVAGDEAARDGERGLIASDLLPALRRLANP